MMDIAAQPPPFPHPCGGAPTSCDLHPDQPVTGFCASCLRERLSGLETSASGAAAPHRKSTSALKSIFFRASGGGHPGTSAFLRPELRRSKSFSGSRGNGSSGPLPSAAFEPQRKSCDVRGRNTLWSLFHQDDRSRYFAGGHDPTYSSAAGGGEIEVEHPHPNLGFPSSSVAAPVLEAHLEEDEIRPADDEPIVAINTSREIGVAEEEEGEAEKEVKSMKDHINLDSQAAKKPPLKEQREVTGSFWLAASVFSKKLQNWRRKQKLKKQNGKAAAAAPQDKTPKSSRRFRDTQSEIAVDAFGRRSCDIDPRFSLDAGRMSMDDPRFSWDVPRSSWDGHLIGGRPMVPRLPPMLSVGEDAAAHIPPVERLDGRISVEEDSFAPGGCLQTREYYLDSSSRRRRSLDRSNSLCKLSYEFNEPAGGTELFHAQNGSKHDRDSKDFSSNSLRDDRSESFESVLRAAEKGEPKKKSSRWSKAWNIWGFIYRRGHSRGDGGGHASVERSFSESWPELREQVHNGKIFRCNSSVSSRNYLYNNAGSGSMRRSNVETDGHGKKRNGEFVLERNRSARYSPSHLENGMLRFYLTPMRRNGSSGKGRHSNTNSFTRTMLGIY